MVSSRYRSPPPAATRALSPLTVIATKTPRMRPSTDRRESPALRLSETNRYMRDAGHAASRALRSVNSGLVSEPTPITESAAAEAVAAALSSDRRGHNLDRSEGGARGVYGRGLDARPNERVAAGCAERPEGVRSARSSARLAGRSTRRLPRARASSSPPRRPHDSSPRPWMSRPSAHAGARERVIRSAC